jgi:hypothetical protein
MNYSPVIIDSGDNIIPVLNDSNIVLITVGAYGDEGVIFA